MSELKKKGKRRRNKIGGGGGGGGDTFRIFLVCGFQVIRRALSIHVGVAMGVVFIAHPQVVVSTVGTNQTEILHVVSMYYYPPVGVVSHSHTQFCFH